MYRIRLIHWNDKEAYERLGDLRGAGFHAEFDTPTPTLLKEMRHDPPDAIVIDLGRLPSQGREVGIAIRDSKHTRHVPIVFVGGVAEKIEKTREHLPDATYCDWTEVREAVETAISDRPKSPIVPPNQMNRGAAKPLFQKLDIKPNCVVSILGAPDNLAKLLVGVPETVLLRTNNRGKRDLTIWFVDQMSQFLDRFDSVTSKIKSGSLWIAYPKKSSGHQTDLTQKMIRNTCVEHGLVDYKVCSIDATWTGIKFTWKMK